jgi:hypothetical protein
MTVALNFSFKTADDKSKSFRISNYEGTLEQGVAKELMDTLVGSKQFMKDGVDQYAIALSAHQVDTESTEVYQTATAK